MPGVHAPSACSECPERVPILPLLTPVSTPHSDSVLLGGILQVGVTPSVASWTRPCRLVDRRLRAHGCGAVCMTLARDVRGAFKSLATVATVESPRSVRSPPGCCSSDDTRALSPRAARCGPPAWCSASAVVPLVLSCTPSSRPCATPRPLSRLASRPSRPSRLRQSRGGGHVPKPRGPRRTCGFGGRGPLQAVIASRVRLVLTCWTYTRLIVAV